MHASKFEAEFDAELDMTAVVTEGKSVGVTFDMDTDFQPVSILKVKKNGILEDWNRAHPDKAVMVGDEVVQVNDIKWHANSQTFAERIKGQFLAAKNNKPGAKNRLALYIQRPRKERVVRYQAQREDLHRKLYSAEFDAEISMKGVLPREPIHQAMGWRLNSSVDWQPVSVEKLRATGLIAKYNKEHPDAKIRAGDEIIKVNHIQWHHSSTAFAERLGSQFVAAQKREHSGSSEENVLKLRIRRPRSAHNEAPEEQVYTKYYTVHLDLKDSHKLGWHLNASNDTSLVTVDKIMSKKGHPIAMYNAANPTNAVQVGDNVVRVNNVTWHGNAKKFVERIDKEFARARPRKGGTPHSTSLELLMMRRLVQPIAKEWTVTVPAEEGGVLGWQLNYSEDSFPLTVAKVRNSGAVFEFNQDHPDSRVVPGDVIVKVDAGHAIGESLWREDSSSFEKRLNELFSKAKKIGNISFFMRRPEGVRDTTNDAAADRPFFREFIVNLPVQKALGWQLQFENDTSPLSVAKIRATGAVHDWNERNPLNDIQVGDHIAKVNNVFWHNNTESFLAKVNLQMKLAREAKLPAKPVVQLLVQRPWRTYATESTVSTEDSSGDAAGASEEDDLGAVN
mmetsp:Transcript_123821/g.332534  ORF Transcript_123821/g.332534 Transcript_123821/m.332534 type:complete len:620 (-) Transcript_123821:189-2048(-)